MEMMDRKKGALLRRARGFSQVALWPTLLCLGVGVTLLAPLPVAHADTDPKAQMLLGNPDKAKNSPTSREHFLIKRDQIALSYNDKWRFPNWVAWHLTVGDIGSTERGQFQPDQSLPTGFTRVTTRDYTSSGYDRGHNAPSKDRSNTRANNDAVFLMTNITPQQHGMNAGPWEQLESYCRQLAQSGNELYIQCGHGFTDPKYKTLGRANIAVPDFGWKFILVLPEKGGNDLARITEQTRVIAVKMPNISTISKKDWREFRLSAGEIEQATGLTFFDALPKKLADTLRSKVDFDQSAPSKRKKAAAADPVITGGKTTTGGATPPAGVAGGAGQNNGGAGQVWVNTKSGVIWKPGSQYYGKTKQGKYMSEAEALKAGYHFAGGQ